MNTQAQLAGAEKRRRLINLAATLVKLAASAQESILLGDFAQACGNLEALSSVNIDLRIEAKNLNIAEHQQA